MPVHNIHMDTIGSTCFTKFKRFGKLAEITGKNTGTDQHIKPHTMTSLDFVSART